MRRRTRRSSRVPKRRADFRARYGPNDLTEFRGRSAEGAIVAAVNHDGDSDSTGAITGNIVVTLYGVEALPGRWLEQVELREVIDQVATGLARPRAC